MTEPRRLVDRESERVRVGTQTAAFSSDRRRRRSPEAPIEIVFDRVIPVLRIFDIAKADEFYLGLFGF
jgi:Glyoxalase superfamily protein